jgi:hypothetical protein
MVNNSYVSGSLILFNRHILFYIKSSSGFLLIERVALINIIITQGAKLFGPLKSLFPRDECPAPNQLRNSGRVGAMDYPSDNLEMKTPEALDEWSA